MHMPSSPSPRQYTSHHQMVREAYFQYSLRSAPQTTQPPSPLALWWSHTRLLPRDDFFFHTCSLFSMRSPSLTAFKLRKRKADPDLQELVQRFPLGVGVPWLNINSFTEHSHQKRPLWGDWDTSRHTGPLRGHVWTQIKHEHCPNLKKDQSSLQWVNLWPQKIRPPRTSDLE